MRRHATILAAAALTCVLGFADFAHADEMRELTDAELDQVAAGAFDWRGFDFENSIVFGEATVSWTGNTPMISGQRLPGGQRTEVEQRTVFNFVGSGVAYSPGGGVGVVSNGIDLSTFDWRSLLG